MRVKEIEGVERSERSWLALNCISLSAPPPDLLAILKTSSQPQEHLPTVDLLHRRNCSPTLALFLALHFECGTIPREEGEILASRAFLNEEACNFATLH